MKSLGLPHQGVVVTLEDGSRHLIHKTKGGTNPDNRTVITSATDMSNQWTVKAQHDAKPDVTVGDLVKASGDDYNPFWDNCIFASRSMMAAATETEH